jgi:hypothetical protein
MLDFDFISRSTGQNKARLLSNDFICHDLPSQLTIKRMRSNERPLRQGSDETWIKRSVFYDL